MMFLPPNRHPFRLRAALLPLAALTLLVTFQGCASNPVPEGNMRVQVLSDPPGLKLNYKNRAVGRTPVDLKMIGLEETAWLRVESPDDKVLERRIQILGPNEVRVQFSISDEAGAVAKALGLTNVVVFDYGNRTSFEVNKSDLKPDMKPTLEIQAEMLKGQFKNLEAFVCGHTDSTGEDDHNRLLSIKRAQAVADFLIAAGVDKGQLNVQGFGEDYPLAPNDTPEGQALNRRTEIILGDS